MSTRRSVHRLARFTALLGLAALGGPLVAQSMPSTVAGVSVKAGDTTQVVIDLDGAVAGSAVSSFVVGSPDRVVVDIAGVLPGGAGSAQPGGVVDRVDVSTLQDAGGTITRVTLYLNTASTHQVRVDGERVVVALTPGTGLADPLLAATGSLDTRLGAAQGPGTPSGPRLSTTFELASLDFVDGDQKARVVIGLNRMTDYTTSQPQKDLVVIDLPGVKVGGSLQRPLDTSRFVSPVESVRAYPTSTGTRVAVRLERSVDWQVRAGDDNLLTVDFDVPADFRAQRQAGAYQGFTEVAPDTPTNNGLNSAYASETLIGNTGRTVNPQDAFGSGRGTADPAYGIGGMPGFSMDTSSASAGSFTGRPISLDLVEADIHDVFRLISHVSRLNIVAGDDVKGSVTVRLIDVPWDQALTVILQAKGLASQRFDNIIRVAPIETIKAEQQAALDASRAQEELKPLQLLVIPLNYANATDVEAQVKTHLSPRGAVDTDERSNQVVIKDTEDSLAQLRELVRTIDRETPQVVIEARVVEAAATFSRSLGIQWGGDLNISAATGGATGLWFPNSVGVSGGQIGSGQTSQATFYSPGADNFAVDLGAAAPFGSLALALGSIPGVVNLDVRLSAAEAEGYAEIVSSPRIVTLDNTPATVLQGAQIPFLSTSAGGTQVQFKEAALKLEVTPHITADRKVFLDLTIENNRPDFSQVVLGQPAIQVKEAAAQLLVADGDTAVIGGVYATDESRANNRIPFLGSVPVLGSLFRNSSHTLNRQEMLLFVTPQIVTGSTQATAAR